MAGASKIKVCYVLAYKEPNYTRTASLLNALRQLPNVELIDARNTSLGLWRYPQAIGKLIKARLTQRPDVYLLGFRGHEVLGLVRVLTAGKPLIFDEFVNLDQWLVTEHRKLKSNSPLRHLARNYVRLFLKSCQKILADTALHAASSSRSYNLPLEKYAPVYVGADERLFRPTKAKASNEFTVFFYGTWLPLHGVDIILEAAKKLEDLPVKFVLVGGKGSAGANVELLPRVPYEKLPELIASSNLCLGGPFGDTPQSRLVISGKTFQFLAMAKPTIVGKIAQDDGFVDKQNCLLVRQGSAEKLAEVVKWAYQNRAKLETIGKAGRKLYDERFASPQIATELKKVIESL